LRERVDINEKIEIFDRVKKPGNAPFGTQDKDGIPPMPAFGEGEKLLVTGSTHDDFGFRKTDSPAVHSTLINRINDKILNNREKITQTESYHLEDAEVIVISYGFTARSSLYAVDALRAEGKKVGLFRLKTIWPFPDNEIQEIDGDTIKFFIPEMNRGQVAGELKKYMKGDVITYNQTNGEIIHPNNIIHELRKLF